MYNWYWDKESNCFIVRPKLGEVAGRIAGPTNRVEIKADPNRQIDTINRDGSDRG